MDIDKRETQNGKFSTLFLEYFRLKESGSLTQKTLDRKATQITDEHFHVHYFWCQFMFYTGLKIILFAAFLVLTMWFLHDSELLILTFQEYEILDSWRNTISRELTITLLLNLHFKNRLKKQV